MRIVKFIPFILLLGCTNLADAPLGENGTFQKIYGNGATALIARDLKTTNDGYIGLGITNEEDSEASFIYLFDRNGNVLDYLDNSELSGFVGHSLTKVDENTFFVTGDEIYEEEDDDNTALQIRTVRISGATLQVTPLTSQDSHRELYRPGQDVHGYAAYGALPEIVVLGAVETGDDATDLSLWIGLDESGIIWQQQLLGSDNTPFDLESSRAIHMNQSGNYILNANRGRLFDEEIITSFVIGSFARNSNNVEGITDGNQITPNTTYINSEIQPQFAGDRFAVIGTTNVRGDNNLDIFIHLIENDATGSPVNLKVLENTIAGTPNAGNDFGLSLDSTPDGFIMLGSRLTQDVNDNEGLGDYDFLLMRTDASGNPIWDQILGSSGNESTGVVRQSNDGGFVIFGTSEFRGANNFVLIKTDENGNVK